MHQSPHSPHAPTHVGTTFNQCLRACPPTPHNTHKREREVSISLPVLGSRSISLFLSLPRKKCGECGDCGETRAKAHWVNKLRVPTFGPHRGRCGDSGDWRPALASM